MRWIAASPGIGEPERSVAWLKHSTMVQHANGTSICVSSRPPIDRETIVNRNSLRLHENPILHSKGERRKEIGRRRSATSPADRASRNSCGSVHCALITICCYFFDFRFSHFSCARTDGRRLKGRNLRHRAALCFEFSHVESRSLAHIERPLPKWDIFHLFQFQNVSIFVIHTEKDTYAGPERAEKTGQNGTEEDE